MHVALKIKIHSHWWIVGVAEINEVSTLLATTIKYHRSIRAIIVSLSVICVHRCISIVLVLKLHLMSFLSCKLLSNRENVPFPLGFLWDIFITNRSPVSYNDNKFRVPRGVKNKLANQWQISSRRCFRLFFVENC